MVSMFTAQTQHRAQRFLVAVFARVRPRRLRPVSSPATTTCLCCCGRGAAVACVPSPACIVVRAPACCFVAAAPSPPPQAASVIPHQSPPLGHPCLSPCVPAHPPTTTALLIVSLPCMLSRTTQPPHAPAVPLFGTAWFGFPRALLFAGLAPAAFAQSLRRVGLHCVAVRVSVPSQRAINTPRRWRICIGECNRSCYSLAHADRLAPSSCGNSSRRWQSKLVAASQCSAYTSTVVATPQKSSISRAPASCCRNTECPTIAMRR